MELSCSNVKKFQAEIFQAQKIKITHSGKIPYISRNETF